MSIPHRNNPPAAATRRPDQNHKPTGEKAGRDKSFLPVISTFVRRGRVSVRKNRSRISEIKPPLC
jgi:hypothetical protein